MPVIEVPEQQVQATAVAVHAATLNKNNPDKIDREKMPLLSWLKKRKQEMTFTRGIVVQKIQRAGDSRNQYLLRNERLEFKEDFPEDEMVWDPYRVHKGRIITHADLEDRGLSVVPNDGSMSGPNIQKMPRAAGEVLFDYFKMVMDNMSDDFDVGQNYDLWRDGTFDPLAPVGMDGLLPLDNTTGRIGGKDRSDPSFRHIVIPGSTVGAAGTLSDDLDRGIILAENYTRGVESTIDTIFAGDDWIEGYKAYARANGLRYQTEAGSPTSLDISIPDKGLHFNNIPIIRVPTFRSLDANGEAAGSTPFAKRAYFLNSKTWNLGFMKGKDKVSRSPVDPADQLISRFSLLGRYALTCRFPRGQFVSTIA